ncbi:hypothetical protein [Pseudomonas sp. ABFPK]|uniref:hypothetical protein n=1 Tax=Pseudomonas sp. ABFPK TaxID=1636605 RepID=UPI000778D71B|nr:hypothetical protein [Pseudomonas sp. ABFPK]KYC23199.1 hypothetical protein WM94_10980 [Pseudomonas sp. ABFPK]KYC23209.1 hypothetical protein WM94_11030 [Pseudomonas sp. ABFPK]
MLKKIGKKSVVAVFFTAAVSANAFAADAGWDYSSLTSSVDFSTISVGVLAVAALLAAVYAGIKGAKIVLAFLR